MIEVQSFGGLALVVIAIIIGYAIWAFIIHPNDKPD